MTTKEPTESVAVRLPRSVISQVDDEAKQSGRSRANYLAFIIGRATNEAPLERILRTIIESIRESEPGGRRPDSYEENFGRGQLHAAKWVMRSFLGTDRLDALLDKIRSEIGPIPHVVGRDQKGDRFGFDSDAG